LDAFYSWALTSKVSREKNEKGQAAKLEFITVHPKVTTHDSGHTSYYHHLSISILVYEIFTKAFVSGSMTRDDP
jgi:hypothetical protein